MLQVEATDGTFEEVGTLLPPIEQDDLQIPSGVGQDQPGQTTPAPQVEQPTLSSLEHRDVLLGVSDRLVDGAIAEKAETLRLAQRFEQIRVSDHDQAGLMTTRRFGSSPSDLLVTPSISVIASCTTLRSADDIGSSAFVLPDSTT